MSKLPTKFYAVKSGRQTGVFRSWEECERQVKGYKCAVYKSFKTQHEAERFLYPSEVEAVEEDVITIYTDGSHQRVTNYLGIGAWCMYCDEVYELSQECDTELLSTYGITDSKVSNPTAEFIAFTEVLKHLVGIPTKHTIKFMIDYIGVNNWVRGDWKTSEPYIKQILSVARERISQLGCKIIIEHVDGHSNNFGNDQADRLAKSHANHNNFNLLIERLK